MQFLYKTVLNINSKFIRLKLIFMTLKINKKTNFKTQYEMSISVFKTLLLSLQF